MAKLRTIHRRVSNKPKAKGQQHRQRSSTLFRKAFEFTQECDADVLLVLRSRKTGQIYIYNSNDQWFPSQEDLTYCYPTPLRITGQELAAEYKAKSEN
ncbi:hypothetical protein BDV06DRAFT_207458 [Aspergillus oleicola]